MPRLTRAELRRRYGARPDAAGNARPRKVMIVHALQGASILRDPLDMRTKVGKAHRERCALLSADLGGDLSVAMATLVDQASRLHLLTKFAWTEIGRRGAFKNGCATPAVEAYLRATAREADVLRMLGLERRAKPVPDLQTYLRALAEKKAQQDSSSEPAEDAQLVEPAEASTTSPPEATTDGSAHPQPSAAA